MKEEIARVKNVKTIEEGDVGEIEVRERTLRPPSEEELEKYRG